MSDTSTDGTEWSFDRDDVIEMRENVSLSIGPSRVTGSQYTVLRRLRDEEDGERFYQVKKEDGDSHLYAASAIEGTWRSVDTDTDH